MVQLIIQYGASALAQSWFITLTYDANQESARAAAVSVNKDFRRLLLSLKKDNPHLTWFRMMELTKEGIPHFHLIVGNLRNGGPSADRPLVAGQLQNFSQNLKVRCSTPRDADWVNKPCPKNCIQHEWGKAWTKITGSYIVGVRRTTSPHKAASYMAKYLTKGLLHREALETLGFKRKWSCSRNWPRPTPTRLIGSVDGAWTKVERINWGVAQALVSAVLARSIDHPLVSLVGDPIVMEWQEASIKQRTFRKLSKLNKEIQHEALSKNPNNAPDRR